MDTLNDEDLPYNPPDRDFGNLSSLEAD